MAPEVKSARTAEPADESDVMREQLDYLIDHIALNAACGCCECRRYFRVRTALLEIFDSPQRGPRLMKAA